MQTMEIFKINAVWLDDICYSHFGVTLALISIYGDKAEDIEEITMKVSENQTKTDDDDKIDYWGWFDFEDKRFTNMIYSSYFLLNMCFPSSIEISERTGRGKAYRLEVIEGEHKSV